MFYKYCEGPAAGSLFTEGNIRFTDTMFVRLANIPSLVNVNHSNGVSGTKAVFQLKFE